MSRPLPGTQCDHDGVMTTSVMPPIERGDAGPVHLCHKDHRWQHTGPSAASCRLPTLPNPDLLSEADCAVCAGRDELLTRPPHSHECQFCTGEWVHEGRCAAGLVESCPWDFPGPGGDSASGTRIGRHLHGCPVCGGHWSHDESCRSPWRAALAACPGCEAMKPAASTIVTRSPRRTRKPSQGRWVWRTAGGMAAIALAILGYQSSYLPA